MIDWIWRKLFGSEDRFEIVAVGEPRSEEQMSIQRELGISLDDDGQAWLQLHRILKSHEDRITALERKK